MSKYHIFRSIRYLERRRESRSLISHFEFHADRFTVADAPSVTTEVVIVVQELLFVVHVKWSDRRGHYIFFRLFINKIDFYI